MAMIPHIETTIRIVLPMRSEHPEPSDPKFLAIWNLPDSTTCLQALVALSPQCFPSDLVLKSQGSQRQVQLRQNFFVCRLQAFSIKYLPSANQTWFAGKSLIYRWWFLRSLHLSRISHWRHGRRLQMGIKSMCQRKMWRFPYLPPNFIHVIFGFSMKYIDHENPWNKQSSCWGYSTPMYPKSPCRVIVHCGSPTPFAQFVAISYR